jgi:hypothetical protein
MKNLGICIPLCRGLWGSPVCPLPKKITIVFGAPLNFKMEGNSPTDAELEAAHEKFMMKLKHLFDEHKTEYGYGNRELEIL